MKDPYYHNRFKNSKKVRRIREKMKPLSEQIKSASRMLIITVFSLLIVTMVSFLYIRGLQSGKGYYLEQLQAEYETLSSDNRELQSLLNDAQAMINVNDSENVSEMDAPLEQNLDYVHPNTGVATR